MKPGSCFPITRCRPLLMLIILSFLYQILQAGDTDSLDIYIRNFSYQKALDLIERSEGAATNPVLLDQKAVILKGLNKYPEAIEVWGELLKDDTTDVRLLTEIAGCYQSLGQYEQAQSYYLRALKSDPQNQFLILRMADAHFMDEEFEEALSYYREAYTMDSSLYVTRQMARSFEKLKKSDSAIFYFQKAFTRNPADYQTVYRLADLYQKQQDYPAALETTQRYLEKDSLRVSMLKFQGYIHFLNLDYPMAIACFEKCLTLHDSSDFTIKYLGYSYFRNEDYMEAKDYLEKAYLQDTTDIDICYALGLSCDYSVYKKLGIEYLERTIDLATPSSQYLSRIYQDLAAANTGYYKYEDALAAYMKAYELNPQDTLLIFKIASHYDNWIKDPEKATEYYKLFLSTRPEHRKSLPKVPGTIVLSYYDFAERRIREIKEESFWRGEMGE